MIFKVLARIARKYIQKFNPFVIAITGSVGKTGTKEAVFAVLRDAFFGDVWRTEGNLNAEIGIPLTIMGCKKVPNKFAWPAFLLINLLRPLPKKYPKYLVLEMGVEHRGDIAYFSSIVRPDIALITSVSPAHTVNFKNVPEFEKEKFSLISKLKENGIAILNHDDPVLASEKAVEADIHFVGLGKGADYFADEIKPSVTGTEFRINCPGHKLTVKSKILGSQSVYSALFAFAVADRLGLPLIRTAKAIEGIKSLPGRMNYIAGEKDTAIIDDTYNSNPASVRAAVDFLSNIEAKARKILILGNMNELGAWEKEEHEKAAQYARGKFDLAVFAGPNAKFMAKAYGGKSQVFLNRFELIKELKNIVREKDILLVKASQNKNFFEEVVKFLMQDKSHARQILVRQGREWLKKKKQI